MKEKKKLNEQNKGQFENHYSFGNNLLALRTLTLHYTSFFYSESYFDTKINHYLYSAHLKLINFQQ